MYLFRLQFNFIFQFNQLWIRIALNANVFGYSELVLILIGKRVGDFFPIRTLRSV